MEVILAKSAGFCFGVKRAVDTVYEQIEKSLEDGRCAPIYTYGPIIHNESVVGDLEKKRGYSDKQPFRIKDTAKRWYGDYPLAWSDEGGARGNSENGIFLY